MERISARKRKRKGTRRNDGKTTTGRHFSIKIRCPGFLLKLVFSFQKSEKSLKTAENFSFSIFKY